MLTLNRYKTSAHPQGSRLFGTLFALSSFTLLTIHLQSTSLLQPAANAGVQLHNSYDLWELVAPLTIHLSLLISGIALVARAGWSSIAVATFAALAIMEAVFIKLGWSLMTLTEVPIVVMLICLLLAAIHMVRVWTISVSQRRRHILLGLTSGVSLSVLLLAVLG